MWTQHIGIGGLGKWFDKCGVLSSDPQSHVKLGIMVGIYNPSTTAGDERQRRSEPRKFARQLALCV